MIDIHSHFVWGLDDGPSSIDDSLAMLRVAADDGITDIVATPHFNAQYPFQPDLLRSHVQELAGHTAGKPAIHYGCEFQLTSDNLGPLLENPFAFTINGGPYLLVELPNSHIAKHTESFLTRLVDARIVPVLVHPERNVLVLRDLDRLERWVELGCLVQVTALSITGGFGGAPKSGAIRLLDRGLVHSVASDAHDPSYRPPILSAAYDAVRARAGQEAADLLLTDHPRDMVQGRPLPGGRLILDGPPKRRWWHF